MPFEEKWAYPEGRFLSEAEARALLAGPLGEQQRAIVAASMTSIYWHYPDDVRRRTVAANGTLTIVQGAGEMFGVTAAHVVRGYLADAGRAGCVLQFGNAAAGLDVIAIDDNLDLATLRLPRHFVEDVGKPVAPVSLPRLGDVPQEGRGIMIGGYIGADREQLDDRQIGWGMFYACGVARRVSARQISWAPDHEYHIPVEGIPALEANKELGGISGGPLLAWFEKPGGTLAWYSLAGIVVEQSAALEYIVATRADYIRTDGRLSPP